MDLFGDLEEMLPLLLVGGVALFVMSRMHGGASSPATPATDQTQGSANTAAHGGNAFTVTDANAWRHFDGNWYATVSLDHSGPGGTFVAQLDYRDNGTFGAGFNPGSWQHLGSWQFTAPSGSQAITTSSPTGYAANNIGFFDSPALQVTILGLSGERYVTHDVNALQGGV